MERYKNYGEYLDSLKGLRDDVKVQKKLDRIIQILEELLRLARNL